MAFSDDPDVEHRWINFGWAPRAETAEQVAHRVQQMAKGLGRDEPDLSPLWLQFTSRATRPTDPERADTLSIEDLARLIDRRGRADPPPLPAPVGPAGYSLHLGGPPSTDPSQRIDMSVSAGVDGSGWAANGGAINLLPSAPIWRETERGLAIVRILVGAWAPDDVGAYGLRRLRDDEPYNDRPVRPWIVWSRDGVDYESYKFTDVGEPALALHEMGGTLRVWP